MNKQCLKRWSAYALSWAGLLFLIFVITMVLSRPMIASERSESLLRPGYIPQTQKTPLRSSKTISTGRIYTYRGVNRNIRLRTYKTPYSHVTTGRIGNTRIRINHAAKTSQFD